ncbi:hypothetical protein DPEC_G00338030 [Dallia pectoralis]|uniref:Uncharacterized protein n=1 Tax=Dallia pectoralis TaxID=75939 RepID=A0ACC2F4K6_DALPE|nr:hypothetical protein DPEC_G00338030 [Dallia pectoralis]
MAAWAGFSDAELRKLQQKDQVVPAALGRGRKPAPTNRSRQQLQREKALQLAAEQKGGPGSPTVPVEQQLMRPPAPPTKPRTQVVIQPVNHSVAVDSTQKDAFDLNHAPAEDNPPIARELDKQEVELREKSRFELLQRDQKMIEEKNKRKKALLTKTIAEKSKQTQAEAVKLKRIHKELQTLDDMVSNDIGILRGVIEQASMDYSTARKRYEKAEAEYVTAKLDLHKKTVVKEQLTEHLCAIIQQNELRKAHKLEELLQQLQLQTTEEEPQEDKRETEKGGVENTAGTEDRGVTEVQEESQSGVPSSPDTESTAGVQQETHQETQAASTTFQQVCPVVTEPEGRYQNRRPSDSPLAVQNEMPASPS